MKLRPRSWSCTNQQRRRVNCTIRCTCTQRSTRNTPYKLYAYVHTCITHSEYTVYSVHTRQSCCLVIMLWPRSSSPPERIEQQQQQQQQQQWMILLSFQFINNFTFKFTLSLPHQLPAVSFRGSPGWGE